MRQHRSDRVAPLDDDHRVVVQQLCQPQIESLIDLIEPVHVEVVEVEPTRVALHESEGRARDRLLHTQTTAETLHEDGLAGPQIAR